MVIHYQIKENALIARISAFKLKQPVCAIVVHKTIYLWGINKSEFLGNESYLNHELQHLFQYREHGTLRFLIVYLIESIVKGYYNNKFEIEARAAEHLPRKAEYVLVED